MRIIALMNQKGGVGKTTTTANLGAALAEMGQKVCLVDLDPQAHLTINYGLDPTDGGVNLYDVLVEEHALKEALRKIDAHTSLIPSSIDLAAAEVELVSVLGRETVLKRRLEEAALRFDFMLMDCPPSLGLLSINALAVADEVIIPMQPQFLALQGVGKLLETIALVNRRMNPALKVTGIVLTMYDSQTKLSTEVVGDLVSFLESARGKPHPWSEARIFQTKIRRNIKLAESPSFGQTILRYEPMSHGADDYRALAREVLAMTKPPAPATLVAAPSATTVSVNRAAVARKPPTPQPPATAVAAAPITAAATKPSIVAPIAAAVTKPATATPPMPPKPLVAAAAGNGDRAAAHKVPALSAPSAAAAPTPSVSINRAVVARKAPALSRAQGPAAAPPVPAPGIGA